MMIEKSILSVSEAATKLSCSDSIVYRLIHAKALGAYKDVGGRRWRIPEASITGYIESRMSAYASMR